MMEITFFLFVKHLFVKHSMISHCWTMETRSLSPFLQKLRVLAHSNARALLN